MNLQQIINSEILGRIYGRSSADVQWSIRSPQCWASGIDFSCISAQAVTAVSRRFVVQASHYATDGPVGFVGRDGVIVSRAITQYKIPGTDICVGRLEASLPATVTPVRLARPEMLLRGTLLLATNQDKCAAVSWISQADPSQVYLATDTPNPMILPWMPLVRGGDSGSPLGVIIDGEFLLVTLYWTAISGNNYPALLPQINAAIRQLGGADEDLAELWQPCDPGDINKDGVTDASDLNGMTVTWQRRTRLYRGGGR